MAVTKRPRRSKRKGKKPKHPDYEALLATMLKREGLGHFKREFSFNPRFSKHAADFVFYDERLVVEVEGGVWSYGRHNRAPGFIADCKKYNLVAVRGYRLLRIVSHWITQEPDYVLRTIKDALETAI